MTKTDTPSLPDPPPRPWLGMPPIGQAASGFLTLWVFAGPAWRVANTPGFAYLGFAGLGFLCPLALFVLGFPYLLASVPAALLRWPWFRHGVLLGFLSACMVLLMKVYYFQGKF